MKLNEKGMALYRKWENVYYEELERQRAARGDADWIEGWCIIDDDDHIRNVDDEVGLLVFGDDDGAIYHIIDCVESRMFRGYDDTWAFDVSCRDMIFKLMPYFDVEESERVDIIKQMNAKTPHHSKVKVVVRSA